MSASADSGARNGVNQAITAVKRQALGAFDQALKPNLSELNQAVQDIQEARKGFKNAARYLTWKAVGLYILVAVLPLLALLVWDRHLVQKIESERTTINSLDKIQVQQQQPVKQQQPKPNVAKLKTRPQAEATVPEEQP